MCLPLLLLLLLLPDLLQRATFVPTSRSLKEACASICLPPSQSESELRHCPYLLFTAALVVLVVVVVPVLVVLVLVQREGAYFLENLLLSLSCN